MTFQTMLFLACLMYLVQKFSLPFSFQCKVMLLIEGADLSFICPIQGSDSDLTDIGPNMFISFIKHLCQVYINHIGWRAIHSVCKVWRWPHPFLLAWGYWILNFVFYFSLLFSIGIVLKNNGHVLSFYRKKH